MSPLLIGESNTFSVVVSFNILHALCIFVISFISFVHCYHFCYKLQLNSAVTGSIDVHCVLLVSIICCMLATPCLPWAVWLMVNGWHQSQLSSVSGEFTAVCCVLWQWVTGACCIVAVSHGCLLVGLSSGWILMTVKQLTVTQCRSWLSLTSVKSLMSQWSCLSHGEFCCLSPINTVSYAGWLQSD